MSVRGDGSTGWESNWTGIEPVRTFLSTGPNYGHGGMHRYIVVQDTDGSSIFIAEQQHIPIFEELEFFKQYDIDADIEQFGGGAV